MRPELTTRVRFAPSPTGFLHVGGLRTALYNYLFAKKVNGVFILRIEDTDRSRYVEGAVANLIETLRWAGLDYDEGPTKGGHYGPYTQSERLDIYRTHVALLVASQHAYRCFCTAERIDEIRKEKEHQNLTTKYDRHCLKLTPSEVEDNLGKGLPHVVRLKIPDAAAVLVQDQIRGEISISSENLDDQILMKSDGYPTYHLANVVDDHLMNISHVIRGEEWLPSTPKHVLLYQAFGWDPPIFAHLPLLLNPDRSKLSKRQGDVAVEEYRAKGYLPEALVNFVALLGWNPGTEEELFSREELIDRFSLDRVNKSGAIFNVEKLDWLNFEHLRRKAPDTVVKMLRDELKSSRFKERDFDDEYLLRVAHAMNERAPFIKDILVKSPYFFEPPSTYEPDAVKKRWKAETPGQLQLLSAEFLKMAEERKEDFELALTRIATSLNISPGVLIHPVRLAISGMSGGPGLYEILSILGKNESAKRIKTALERIRPT